MQFPFSSLASIIVAKHFIKEPPVNQFIHTEKFQIIF